MQSMLLVMCTIWFGMAVRVAVRVIRGQGAEDTRSDDEDEEEDGKDGKKGSEDEDMDGEDEVEVEKIPGKGDTPATASQHLHQHHQGHTQMESAGKALNRMKDKVVCKRDTLKDEAAVRRRR